MLAAAGWPIAEVFDKPLANALNLNSPLADNGDLAPSLLNGGLGLISPAYWVGVVGMAAAVEALGFTLKNKDLPGDYGFDPLGLLTPATETKYKTAELLHGRLAMLAFSGVVTQCALGKTEFPYA